ncbi:nucleotidyltransferase family protein [Methylobacterium sp. SyP6R]|uniref:nucleotidyltransferase family protein n=1 Tax=Methylobacterium sp. SyP6R TaxID=2718876 RepID=UPI001F01BF55|nr:nucleotidyltransferase domain-containing protein [Methylobacterium sp. SyP6R]MCF4128532.1 nucleotidyltransferase domain-containing protein [Methylobacterium sp. SyP6R]
MRRDEVLAGLKSTEPVLRAIGVAALYLFGSHARDEAQEDSDIDAFVDPAPGVAFGFLPVMAAYEAIEAAVGSITARPAAYIRVCARRSSGMRSGCSDGLRTPDRAYPATTSS